jgi:BTB/POZ domain-containing protein KCTD9
MARATATRLSYELSCARLLELRMLADDTYPPMPDRLPQQDDEVLGVSVFRTRLDDDLDLSGLTLRRTFFGRSEINRVSFRNSDLRESNLCWNDFIGTDFARADLAGSDVRSSIFKQVLFVAANLDGADLRGSSFLNCDFKRASMKGTVLTYQQVEMMQLSNPQKREIAWRKDEGEEPKGG